MAGEERKGGAPGGEAAPLVVERMPDRSRYRPGEPVRLEGVRVTCDGEDVTARVRFDVEDGAPWRASDRRLAVTASLVDGEGRLREGSFGLRRRRRLAPLLLALAAAAALAVAAGAVWWAAHPDPGDVGSYVYPQGSMTDEEAVAMLDRQARESAISVSLSPRPQLADGGMLRVNFVVASPNNGLSERLEVEQGGEVVYRSGVVRPGYRIEWAQAPRAQAGPATATVYAVDGSGRDSGNPVAVEVEVVPAGS